MPSPLLAVLFFAFLVGGIMLDSGLRCVACLLHPWTASSPCCSSPRSLAIRHGKSAFGYWGRSAVEVGIFT